MNTQILLHRFALATSVPPIAVVAGLLFCPVINASAEDDMASPFIVVPSTIATNHATVVSLSFHIPEHHHIYADRLSFELNGAPVSFQLPAAKRVADRFSKGERLVFERDFHVVCPLPHPRSANLTIAVTFQGCSEAECYFPETHEWSVSPDTSVTSLDDSGAKPPVAAANGVQTNGFQIAARASGFLGSDKFLRFLDQSSGTAPTSGDQFANFARIGIVATLGLILIGGLALNLTPCVLPMIPINLAILGAGTQNQNRRRGFLLGSTYGAGMAFAYGLLGLVVVLTGSKFGTLNASPWFNFGIALVFIVLGMGMFDKLAIDLSRFQRMGGKASSSGSAFLAAGAMGSVSALLAGACVAPVVISVLLLATTFYQKGNLLGLSLPFVLGLGMALPWPFAAAGLSFLPKPGAWMTHVKYGFGVIIFGFAIWYSWLGWNLSGLGGRGAMLVAAKSNNVQDLQAALKQSRTTGRPVVIDFWASWCKNCEAMEHSTFRNAGVRQRLTKEYILVKFQAEHLNDPVVKPVLDEFGVLGLPTYVVLRPDSHLTRVAEASQSRRD